jgi:hypothetical protein
MGWKRKVFGGGGLGSIADVFQSAATFGVGSVVPLGKKLASGDFNNDIKNLASTGTDVALGTIGFGAGLLARSQVKEWLFKDQVDAGFDFEGLRRELQVQESDAATEAAYLRRQALNNNLL